VDVATRFPDASLDWVYLDGNHDLLHVIQDLYAWLPKIRPGGIISGHDFLQRKRDAYEVHVVEAVYAYTGAHFIKPWFLLGSRAIVEGEVRDRPRSWFWVKG
jgi:predicted O-methyltransferase YrrM